MKDNVFQKEIKKAITMQDYKKLGYSEQDIEFVETSKLMPCNPLYNVIQFIFENRTNCQFHRLFTS